jgi:hypothetical protein
LLRKDAEKAKWQRVVVKEGLVDAVAVLGGEEGAGEARHRL